MQEVILELVNPVETFKQKSLNLQNDIPSAAIFKNPGITKCENNNTVMSHFNYK